MQRISLAKIQEIVPKLSVVNLVRTEYNFPSFISNGDSEGLIFLDDQFMDKIDLKAEHKWGACLITGKSLKLLTEFHKTNNTILVVDNPKLEFSRVYQFLMRDTELTGINGYLSPSSTLGSSSYIGPGSFVGPLCKIGEKVLIQPNVVITQNVEIGNGVIIGSGSVIGSRGFGYVKDELGKNIPFPQVGGVVIEDDVEIGSNTSIDGGALTPTVIGRGVKIDNLVHIAHGDEIGNDTLIMAGVVFCGSVTIGKNCWIAPGAVIREHLTIGDNSFIGLGAVVTQSLPINSRVIGNPAREFPNI